MRDAVDPSPPVFDHELLASLNEVLEAGRLGALLEEAEAEIARRLDVVAALRSAEDGCGALRSPAHDLAGLAGQIGLAAMASAARNLECAARAGDAGSSARATEALLGLRARSLAALASARVALASR